MRGGRVARFWRDASSPPRFCELLGSKMGEKNSRDEIFKIFNLFDVPAAEGWACSRQHVLQRCRAACLRLPGLALFCGVCLELGLRCAWSRKSLISGAR